MVGRAYISSDLHCYLIEFGIRYIDRYKYYVLLYVRTFISEYIVYILVLFFTHIVVEREMICEQ